jgi:tetratricopeptide (TPR) repeat protein
VKNVLYILLCFLLLPVENFAQDIAALQKEAERLETTSQEDAFKKYQEILKIQPINVHALCKSSEMCSSIGHRQTAKASQLSYYRAARRYAEVALKLNPDNSEANFTMAMAMGRMALISTGRQRVEAVNDIKKYAELAIKADPNNYKAYHVLGKWHYEVSDLSGFERGAAKMLYGGLPPASIKESISYFEKSRMLSPDFTLNYLELARAYYRDNQKDKAVDMLNKLAAIPVKTQDDPRVKELGKELLNEWKKG